MRCHLRLAQSNYYFNHFQAKLEKKLTHATIGLLPYVLAQEKIISVQPQLCNSDSITHLDYIFIVLATS